jgi:hypothetical protein
MALNLVLEQFLLNNQNNLKHIWQFISTASRHKRQDKYARYTNSTAQWRAGSQHRPKDSLAYKSLENVKVIQINLDANVSTT